VEAEQELAELYNADRATIRKNGSVEIIRDERGEKKLAGFHKREGEK